MTGLRRVILDAIQGVSPEEFEPQDIPGMERGLGVIAEIHPGSTKFSWVTEGLEALNTEMLMGIYDTLRPGVLESMGKGE